MVIRADSRVKVMDSFSLARPLFFVFCHHKEKRKERSGPQQDYNNYLLSVNYRSTIHGDGRAHKRLEAGRRIHTNLNYANHLRGSTFPASILMIKSLAL